MCCVQGCQGESCTERTCTFHLSQVNAQGLDVWVRGEGRPMFGFRRPYRTVPQGVGAISAPIPALLLGLRSTRAPAPLQTGPRAHCRAHRQAPRQGLTWQASAFCPRLWTTVSFCVFFPLAPSSSSQLNPLSQLHLELRMPPGPPPSWEMSTELRGPHQSQPPPFSSPRLAALSGFAECDPASLLHKREIEASPLSP